MTLAAGLTHRFDVIVDGSLMTDVHGTLERAVLSTPAVVYLVEEAAIRAVGPELQHGEVTVGFEIKLRHLRPAFHGESCVVSAELIEIEGNRKLRFEVRVECLDRLIATGDHERRIIRAAS